jgi:hypothetical protein
MAYVAERKVAGFAVPGPGIVDDASDPLLARAREAAQAQEAAIDVSSLESRYTAALAAQLEAKQDQAKRIEDRLEHLITQQAARLEQARARPPGLLTMPSTRTRWQESIQSQQTALLRLQDRLEKVRDIKDGMGPQGPRLVELATRKVRAKNPGLAEGWDEMRQAQRLHQVHLRRLEQEKKRTLEKDQHPLQSRTSSRSLSLSQQISR